jgi:purine nucleosidase
MWVSKPRAVEALRDLSTVGDDTFPVVAPRGFFVDCDPGLDDALALLVLIGLSRRGIVRLDGVSAVFGNAPLQITARNAAYVLERAGIGSSVPVYAGEAGPVTSGLRASPETKDFHGPDALGGLYRPQHPAVAIGAGVAALARYASRISGAVLLALGPLTDVARAVEASPDALASLERVVVMGGTFGDSGAKKVEPEFNWRTDPVAADRVCSSGLMIDVVPFNITGRVLFTRADADALTSAPNGGFAADLLSALLDLSVDPVDAGLTGVHDAVATVLAVQPEFATWQAVSLRVQRDGDHRGVATVGPPGRFPGHARLATSIDAGGARRVILDHLREPPRNPIAADTIPR